MTPFIIRLPYDHLHSSRSLKNLTRQLLGGLQVYQHVYMHTHTHTLTFTHLSVMYNGLAAVPGDNEIRHIHVVSNTQLTIVIIMQ